MRILIDLQGAQSGSRHRGIGRYSTSLAKAIIRNAGNHEVFILLNGLFERDIPQIINDFSSILPEERFVIFSALGPVEGLVAQNVWRREISELIRERMINDLAPDVLLIMSLFEGAVDDSVTSIRRLPTSINTAVILYDLIPFLDPERYIPAPPSSTWYYSKIDSLKKADLLLAISESARVEATDALGFDGERVITIYSAADESFSKDRVLPAKMEKVLTTAGIKRKFLLYTSAFEPRKNFEGLVRAFGLLPKNVRKPYQLVLVTAIDLAGQVSLRNLANDVGLDEDELVFAGYVSDDDLIALYSQCTLFVFPSFHEGFGLPALEAMCCGAAVIGSNTSSIPEVIGKEDALFDPCSDKSMADLIERSLADSAFWESLKAHAVIQPKNFSWDKSAKLAIQALEQMQSAASHVSSRLSLTKFLDMITSIKKGSPSENDLIACANSIYRNENTIKQWDIARQNADAAFARKRLCDLALGESNRAFGDEILLDDSAIKVIRSDVWLQHDQPRILLLKLDHIGDFIITLEAFGLIRDAWPNAHIVLVCASWNKSLAEETGLFDEVFCCDFFPKSGADFDRDSMAGPGLAKYQALSLGSYDLAVDMRYYGDTRSLLLHTNAKYRAGYVASGVKLDVALPEVPETEMVAQIGARAMALAAAVVATFALSSGRAAKILLRGRSPIRSFTSGKVIGIAPGTGNPIKSWGSERFRELARLLHEKGGFKFVLIGAASDCAAAKLIAEILPKSDCLNLAGTLGIPDLSSIIAGFDLFFGNDTSTTHMAALLGVPTICIFSGQSHVDSWRPLGRSVITLKRVVNCSPCYLTKLEKCSNNHLCVNISPTRVAEEGLALLKDSLAE